jgi:hypothetical protein
VLNWSQWRASGFPQPSRGILNAHSFVYARAAYLTTNRFYNFRKTLHSGILISLERRTCHRARLDRTHCRPQRLDENAAAAALQLSSSTLQALEEIFPLGAVAGERTVLELLPRLGI